MIIVFGVTQDFRRMMIESQMDAGDIRQVSRNIPVVNLNLAILHILGMDKLDIVDQLQFVQQNRADQAIHIAASDEAESVSHDRTPLQKMQAARPARCSGECGSDAL
jgi:hypothetical protein